MTPFRRELRVVDPGGRAPPSAPEAELSVVAALFGLPEVDELLELAPAETFADGRHRRVVEAVAALRAEGQTADTTAVRVWLRDRGQLENVGGSAYFAALAEVPLSVHALDHARAVADKAGVRRVLEACQRIAGEAYEATDLRTFANRAAEAVTNAAEQKADASLVLAFDAMNARIAELDEQWQGRRSPRGMPMGLEDLDELTGGLRPGALSVVAAVTGGGKSAFALQVARNVAGIEHNGEPIGVVYVSLEMPVDELVDRTLCSLAEISDEQLQTGALDDEQRERLKTATHTLGALPLWFYTAPVSVAAIRSLTRRAKREFVRQSADPSKPRRIGLVVVDYLGLMDRPDAERNDLAIGQITRGLKLLAMELECHVMLLAQFNRDPSKGLDPPRLSDLKDSSSIEQDANLVLFLHRLFLLLPDRSSEQARALKDRVEVIVAKARRRDTGSVPCRFSGSTYSLEAPHAGDLERWDQAMPKPRNQRRGRR